jgi:hypothetical protein
MCQMEHAPVSASEWRATFAHPTAASQFLQRKKRPGNRTQALSLTLSRWPSLSTAVTSSGDTRLRDSRLSGMRSPCCRVWRHVSNWQRSDSTSLRNGVDSVFIFAAKTTNRPFSPSHSLAEGTRTTGLAWNLLFAWEPMDECGELRWERQGPRRFRRALQPLCLAVATLGIPPLHSQIHPTDQPALLASQVAAAKTDVRVQGLGANADADWLDNARRQNATTPGSARGQPDPAIRSASGKAGAWDEADAYKWDTGAVQDDAFLVRANRDRFVLKMASRPVHEEEQRAGAFDPTPEPAPTLDSAVESLLARMAQAAPAVPPGLSETAPGETNPEAEPPPSTDPAAIESLLARMAAAVSPVPPGVGEGRLATARPAPDLTAASDPEPSERVSTHSASSRTAEQETTEPDHSSLPDAHKTASVEPRRPGLAEPVAAASLSQPTKVLTEAEPRAEAAAPRAPGPVEPPATPGQTVSAAPWPVRTNNPAAAAPQSEPAASAASAPAEGALPRLARSVAATLSKLRSNSLTSVIPGASNKPVPATPSPPRGNSLTASVPARKPATAGSQTSIEPHPTAPPQPVVAASLPVPKKSLAIAGIQVKRTAPVAPAQPEASPSRGAEEPPAARSSARVQSVSWRKPEPKPAANLDPAVLDKLRLRAIAAFGKRRAASINGRSIFQGEEAEFGIDGATLKVRCVEVKESSVLLQIAGMTGTVELTVRQQGRN